jgi:hypothetical protein
MDGIGIWKGGTGGNTSRGDEMVEGRRIRMGQCRCTVAPRGSQRVWWSVEERGGAWGAWGRLGLAAGHG